MEVYLCEYDILEEVMAGLPYFIKEVYNQKRLNSTLDYRPSNEFDELVVIQQHNEVPR